jgi:uncharacterized protein
MPEAFFLTATTAPLFSLHWRGDNTHAPVLLLPPLLEELNKSRRQLNELARALNAAGYPVLLVDWYGTGDSAGELRDASWAQWQADVAAARQFLQQHYSRKPILCALRGGALLLPEHPDCAWLACAPLLDGQQQLTQWLRLKLMAARMAGDVLSSEQLLQQIASGGVEIAGYFLAPALIDPMRQVRLSACAPSTRASRHLIEVTSSEQATPAMQVLQQTWSASWTGVAGDAFWQTTEISVCPALNVAVLQQLAAHIPAMQEQPA